MKTDGDGSRPKFVPCVDAPGYIASEDGFIISPKGKLLKQYPDGNGGLQVHIGDTTIGVHTLILRSFTGRPPKWLKLRPQWRNGDRCDNRLENLMWGKRPKKL